MMPIPLPPDVERAPPPSLSREVMSTTRFFRNRIQHQTALRAMCGQRTLLVGCSRGCEAYALAIEAERLAKPLAITAIDYDPINIAAAQRNTYAKEDFIDFDESSLLTADVLPYFGEDPLGRHVRVDLLRSDIAFRVQNVMDIRPAYDLIVCNNVLIHFQHRDSLAALTCLTQALAPGGVLAVGGINIHILSAFTRQSGLLPITDNIQEIWDGWKGDRLSWEREPETYVAMGPLDRNLPDWMFRFCTLFRKPEGTQSGEAL